MKSPILIIDNPKYAGNLGMICRLVANFALEPLRILGEKRELHFEMEWMAYNAHSELDKMQYFSTFQEASSDLELVIGTGMIHGKDRGKFISLSKLPEIAKGKKIGIVFGREDLGIQKSTAEQCDYMIDFALPGYQKSMNLSHSVAYVLSVLFNQSISSELESGLSSSISDKKNLYSYSQKIFGILGMNDFHGSENLATKRFKEILERSNLSQGDINFLYKMLGRIELLSRKEENQNEKS